MDEKEENKSTKILPNKVGKDGRVYYSGEESPYWGTGAIKCRALVKFCKGAIYDAEGKHIGTCNYEFGTNQDETMCPQCGAIRKVCNKPALKETQEWEVPLCRSHAVGISGYFREIGVALKDEAQVNTLQELMDTDLIPANEVLLAVAANIIKQQIANKVPDWKVMKSIESYYSMLEKAKKAKESKNDDLEKAIKQRIAREAQPIHLEGAIAGIIHTYRSLPKDMKLAAFKKLRQENPALAQQVLLKSGDADLIDFINSIERDAIVGEVIDEDVENGEK